MTYEYHLHSPSSYATWLLLPPSLSEHGDAEGVEVEVSVGGGVVGVVGEGEVATRGDAHAGEGVRCGGVVYFANGESNTSLANGLGPFARSWQDKPCSPSENGMLCK
jgi:hypothetical protein